MRYAENRLAVMKKGLEGVAAALFRHFFLLLIGGIMKR